MTGIVSYLSRIIEVLLTMDAGRLKVKSPYRHTDCAQLTLLSLRPLHATLACFVSPLTATLNTNHHKKWEDRNYQQLNCQTQLLAGISTLFKGLGWRTEVNREEKKKRMYFKKREGWDGSIAMIPTGEVKPSTDCLSTMHPTDRSLHPPSVQWNRCNRNGWTEFSQREFKKGRPCGGLPSKPSCVMMHRMTHPFSSYYKP